MNYTSPIIIPVESLPIKNVVLLRPALVLSNTPTTGDSYWYNYSGVIGLTNTALPVSIGGSTSINGAALSVNGPISATTYKLDSSTSISLSGSNLVLSDVHNTVTLAELLESKSIKAENVSILDSNNYYTSTNVEGALSEIGSLKHTHSNKILLDTYIETQSDLHDAVSKKHSHSNKSVLDNIISSGDGTKALTDNGTYSTILTEDAFFDFSTVSGIGLFDVENWNSAYVAKHTHSNKSLLDSLTGFTNSSLLSTISKSHDLVTIDSGSSSILSATGQVLSISKSSTTSSGYLSSNDFITFNNKLSTTNTLIAIKDLTLAAGSLIIGTSSTTATLLTPTLSDATKPLVVNATGTGFELSSMSLHTHGNKSLLDSLSGFTNTNLLDAITKKHTQNTDASTNAGYFTIYSSGLSGVKFAPNSGSNIITLRTSSGNPPTSSYSVILPYNAGRVALVEETVYKSASSTNGMLVTWNGTTGNYIQDGYTVTTLIQTPFVDTSIPTTKAIVDYVQQYNSGTKRYGGTVRAATTTNGTLASSFANGSVIDGITLATGNVILIKDQTNTPDNGLYTVNASGAPTRVAEMNAAGEFKYMTCFITAGTTNSGSTYTCTTEVTTVGTSPVLWTLTDRSTVYTAGTGLTLTGGVFAIGSSVCTLTGSQTLTNKVLTTPTISSFVNANHTHADSANGGLISFASLSSIPTTLSGYGITDSYTKTEVDLKDSETLQSGYHYYRQVSNTNTTGDWRIRTTSGGFYIDFYNGSTWVVKQTITA